MRRTLLALALLTLVACDSGGGDVADIGTKPPVDAGPTDTGVQQPPDAGMCIDLTLFGDEDGDGYGSQDTTQMACLLPDEELEGFSRLSGDCEPNDPLAYPGAEGVCGDFVDDNCDDEDEDCPTTQQAGLDVPAWDCTGTPPSNVYAYARFDSGEGYFQDGGCFIFFEGLADEFYVMHTMVRASTDASCDTINGCTCPSLNGWPPYDRRMYAYTTDTDLDPCEETYLIDHAFNEQLIQPVSNDCRRYIFQMHFYDIPYNYVSGDLDSLRRRLEIYETLEVACIQDRPHVNLPYQQLLTTQIQLNPGFEKK